MAGTQEIKACQPAGKEYIIELLILSTKLREDNPK